MNEKSVTLTQEDLLPELDAGYISRILDVARELTWIGHLPPMYGQLENYGETPVKNAKLTELADLFIAWATDGKVTRHLFRRSPDNARLEHCGLCGRAIVSHSVTS